MTALLQDVRHSLRQLLRRPAFTATAVLTLAIGMGVNAVAFSVVNGLVFRSGMMRGIPGVGRVATFPGGDEVGYASLPERQRFEDATRGALDLAAEGRSSLGFQHDGVTTTAWVLFVSGSYFDIVRPPVLAGRLDLAPSDATPGAVVGERFWRETLGTPPLAGLELRLNGRSVAVAGIIPESFTGPAGIYSPDVWLPLEHLSLFDASAALRERDTRWLFLLGRLRPGITPAEVQARLDSEAASMARDWPDTHARRGARFRMLEDGAGELSSLRTAAGIGMSIIGLVLLLACFNVANLLLARAVERERDMGIRAAMGARPARLMRLVLVEGVIVAAAAGALALLVAWWTQTIVGSFAIPIEQPQHVELSPDARVVAFIAGLIVVAGVLPGVWPARAAARVDVTRVLGSQGAIGGGRAPRVRRWLVALQVAGSTAFLALAALLVQSYAGVASAGAGFDADRLIVAEFETASHGLDAAATRRYLDDLSRRVRALPGVRDVAAAERAPYFIGYDRVSAVSVNGGPCEPDACPSFATYAVEPGYFETMGIPFVSGETFAGTPGENAVVVDATLAAQLWPGESPLGRTVRIGTEGRLVTVVGVTRTAHVRRADRAQPAIYRPLSGDDLQGPLTLVARTDVPPARLLQAVGRAAHDVDMRIPLTSLKTMDERARVVLWPFRTVSWIFGVCGVLALVLATVGLAGVIAHAVSQRTREFGVRLSIGATRRDLAIEVLSGAARLLVPGLAAGLGAAALLAQVPRTLLVGVDVLDPRTYVAVALLQAVVTGVACLAPALKAARVDPLVALRA